MLPAAAENPAGRTRRLRECKRLFSEDDGWTQVAHISTSHVDMFQGDTKLGSTKEFNCPTNPNTNATTDDFQCQFDDVLSTSNEILFMTGNKNIWATTSYEDFLGAGNNTILFELCWHDTELHSQDEIMGSVMNGDAIEVSVGGLVFWSESRLNNTSNDLKNDNEGVNVYVRPTPSPQFPQWQISRTYFDDDGDDGTSKSLSFSHGVGDGTATQVKIFGFPDPSVASADIADACYSNGGKLLGTFDATGDTIQPTIEGLVISNYAHGFSTEETSFDFSFKNTINENADIYSSSETEESENIIATLRFCVVLELLRHDIPTGNDYLVNYSEYAFEYIATLDGTIVLNDAFQVSLAGPVIGVKKARTFTIEAAVCGPGDLELGDILNQGDSVHICIKSKGFPEASITGVHSLIYTTPYYTGTGGASVRLNAITDGSTVDSLTVFDASTDCNGETCIIKTQLQGIFYPPNGMMTVNIEGLATLNLGGRNSMRSVLAKVVPGDRSLGKANLQGFSIDVTTAAAFDTSADFDTFDTSGTRNKAVTTLSMIMTVFAVATLRFF